MGRITRSTDFLGRRFRLVLTKHPAVQKAKLAASDGGAGDFFGQSVAVSGDTAVVAAPWDDGSLGALYVFARVSGLWREVAKLTVSDGVPLDRFGFSVAIHGDTIVAGAPYANPQAPGSGAAYVFVKGRSGWTTTSRFTARLTASDGSAGDQFGTAVAIHGETVVVGAPYDDVGASNSGSVYVFERPTTGWTTTSSHAARLTASDGGAGDRLGSSVGVSEDTVVAGAPFADGGASKSGAAYVFVKPASGWTTASIEIARLTGAAVTNAYLGSSVAIHGNRVVVGAPNAEGAVPSAGAALLFDRPAAGWGSTSAYSDKLTARGGAAGEGFGYSVAISGKIAIVGSRYASGSAPETGAAYVFRDMGSNTTRAVKLTARDPEAYDWFGFSVAVDGYTALVGAVGGDENAANSGAAYVFGPAPLLQR